MEVQERKKKSNVAIISRRCAENAAIIMTMKGE